MVVDRQFVLPGITYEEVSLAADIEFDRSYALSGGDTISFASPIPEIRTKAFGALGLAFLCLRRRR